MISLGHGLSSYNVFLQHSTVGGDVWDVGVSKADAPWCCCSKVSYNTDEYTYSRHLTLY